MIRCRTLSKENPGQGNPVSLRRLLLLTLLLGIAACVPIRQEAGWPELSTLGDSDNILLTYNDKITMIDSGNGQPVRLRNADGEVRVDGEGNARIWEFGGPQNAPNQFFSKPRLLDEGRLLVLSNSERLYEVNLARADSLLEEGEALPGRVLASALLGEDLIFVGAERTMLALDRSSHDVVWSFDTGQSIWSQPLMLNGMLLFTSLDHNLYALEPQDGTEIWRLDLGGAAPVAPVLYEGRLYTGSFSRKIFEISPEGRILGEFTTEDWVWGAPAIVDDVLYAADLGGNAYALRIDDGSFRLLWRAEVSERAIRATPVVSGDYVIVASRDQKLYWLDRDDGRTYFTRELAGEVVSDMLLLNRGADEEALLAVSTLANEEALIAYGVQNGERRWTYSR